jgi:hypothetical protein
MKERASFPKKKKKKKRGREEETSRKLQEWRWGSTTEGSAE